MMTSAPISSDKQASKMTLGTGLKEEGKFKNSLGEQEIVEDEEITDSF